MAKKKRGFEVYAVLTKLFLALAVVTVSYAAYVLAQGMLVSHTSAQVPNLDANTLGGLDSSFFIQAKQADGSIKVGSFATKPACTSQVVGTLVFDSTQNRLYVCKASGWVAVS